MRQVEIDEPLEITTIGDVPSGTGMGSSSSLTVGLLTALHGYRHRVVSPRLLAEQACRIEIDVLGKPIGRQDQYAAAFGGLNYIRFNPDDTVDVEPVPCRPETLAELERRTLLVYTGQTRDANAILERQSEGTGRPHGRAPFACGTWPTRCDTHSPATATSTGSRPCCTRDGS